ncbi:unnamed protein product [Lathyrus oleraceus]
MGDPFEILPGSHFSSVEEVNIDLDMLTRPDLVNSPLYLLYWLLELTNIKSLTVSSNILQILSLVPDLLKVGFPSLFNLKLLKVKKEHEVTSSSIPDGILDYFLQNSPSAEVHSINYI